MESKELLTSALQLSTALVLPLLEDMQSAPLTPPTVNGGNHAHWILGHLLLAEGQFPHMMRGVANPVEDLRPLFGRGGTPDPTGAGYPPYSDLLKQLVALRHQTLSWLETIGEADLDQRSVAVPPGFEQVFGTWRQCLLMQAMHWMNHRGQLADCRRAAGRDPLMA